MACEYCRSEWKHDTRCPLYIPPKAPHYCSYCNQGIYDGEEYIRNDDGEYRHYDCFGSVRDLIEWFGYKVEIMDEE